MKTVDIAWAAGFIEGEGSFVANSTGKNKARIVVPQVQVEPLLRLRELFGGWVGKKGKASIHVWALGGARAIGLMMTLYTFMSPRRREQIRAVLDAWRADSRRGSRPGRVWFNNAHA